MIGRVALVVMIAFARDAIADGITIGYDVGSVVASGGNPTTSGPFITIAAGYDWQLCPRWLHLAGLATVSSQRETLDLGYGQKLEDTGLGIAGRLRFDIARDVYAGLRIGTFTCGLCRGLEDPRVSVRGELGYGHAIVFAESRVIRWDAFHRPSPFEDERALAIGVGLDASAPWNNVRARLAINDAATLGLFFATAARHRPAAAVGVPMVYIGGGVLAHLVEGDREGAVVSAVVRVIAGGVLSYALYASSTCSGDTCAIGGLALGGLAFIVGTSIDLGVGNRSR